MVNVGKYKSPMHSMGSHIFSFTSACFKLLLDPSDHHPTEVPSSCPMDWKDAWDANRSDEYNHPQGGPL